MLIFCEECGKRYSFPPEKVDPGSNKFRCRECNFLMRVKDPIEEVKKTDVGKDSGSLENDSLLPD